MEILQTHLHPESDPVPQTGRTEKTQTYRLQEETGTRQMFRHQDVREKILMSLHRGAASKRTRMLHLREEGLGRTPTTHPQELARDKIQMLPLQECVRDKTRMLLPHDATETAPKDHASEWIHRPDVHLQAVPDDGQGALRIGNVLDGHRKSNRSVRVKIYRRLGHRE